MVNGWAQRFQGWLLPPTCVLCGDTGQPPTLDICVPCVADLPANVRPCPICAQPLRAGEDVSTPCGSCTRYPRAFDRAVSPFLYDYPLDHLLHAFKYGGALSYGRVLGTLLAHHIRARVQPLPEALIPVPLHHTRHRERGFNQAFELSRPLAALLGLPVDGNLCRRRKATVDQTELKAAQRRRNMKNAFRLFAAPGWKHVALVDDVLTTGSTTHELARLLKRTGVEQVEVWTVARARLGANT